jgi:hypothetical protein
MLEGFMVATCRHPIGKSEQAYQASSCLLQPLIKRLVVFNICSAQEGLLGAAFALSRTEQDSTLRELMAALNLPICSHKVLCVTIDSYSPSSTALWLLRVIEVCSIRGTQNTDGANCAR